MGCPIDLVCEKGMGAALMGRTQKLRGIISVSSRNSTSQIVLHTNSYTKIEIADGSLGCKDDARK